MLKTIATLVILAFFAAAAMAQSPAPAQNTALVTVPARASTQSGVAGYDGVVEAVRQTVMAAQVAGGIVELGAKAGDLVKRGQVLARIDARAADQSAAASQAQVQAARASLEVAAKDFERQKQLFQKRFISQAALDQAEAVYKAATSQVTAQIAQAGAARSQSDFFVLRAPYDGIVSDVPVVLGDMAMPGRPIMTMYDPSALRVTAAIPQTIGISPAVRQAAKAELPGAAVGQQWITPSLVTVLPTVDPSTHTLQIRLDLGPGTANVTPGMFARVWLPAAGSDAGVSAGAKNADRAERVFVPAGAIVRRAEMTGAYVVDANGKPMLRQVRLGRTTDDSVEILSGIAAGERVAADPQAAARMR
ncbi:MAG: efflux RND transporter periplasmic adaptor subunit [Usitatibacteraceae bacterium]